MFLCERERERKRGIGSVYGIVEERLKKETLVVDVLERKSKNCVRRLGV